VSIQLKKKGEKKRKKDKRKKECNYYYYYYYAKLKTQNLQKKFLSKSENSLGFLGFRVSLGFS